MSRRVWMDSAGWSPTMPARPYAWRLWDDEGSMLLHVLDDDQLRDVMRDDHDDIDVDRAVARLRMEVVS